MATSETYRRDSGIVETGLAFVKRISWGAVIAGVVVAMVIQVLLSVLGIAIGAGTVDPLTEQNPLSGVATGAGIWFGVSTLIALFAGGWVSGRLAGIPRNIDSTIHGFLAWGVTTLLTLYLLTTAVGAFVGGTASTLSQGLAAAGQNAQGIESNLSEAGEQLLRDAGIDIDPLMNDIKQVTRRAGPNAENQIVSTMTGIATSGKRSFDENDRSKLTSILTTEVKMDHQEATATVDRWDRTYQQVSSEIAEAKPRIEQKAREAGDTAAQTLSQAAFWTFLGFLFGAIAASIGGYLSRPRDIAVTTSAQPAYQTTSGSARVDNER